MSFSAEDLTNQRGHKVAGYWVWYRPWKWRLRRREPVGLAAPEAGSTFRPARLLPIPARGCCSRRADTSQPPTWKRRAKSSGLAGNLTSRGECAHCSARGIRWNRSEVLQKSRGVCLQCRGHRTPAGCFWVLHQESKQGGLQLFLGSGNKN